MPVIQKDAAETVEDGDLSQDEAAEALLTRFLKESPEDQADDSEKKEKKVNTKDEDAEDDSESEDETSGEDLDEEAEDSEEETDEDGSALDIIEDDTDKFVKIKVDGEDRTVSVKDLKRLFGQEASLTRKSQEISKKRKEAEEQGAKYVAGVTGLLTKAQQKAQPYKNVDWLAAAQQLKPEDLSALRSEAEQAFAEEKYLGEELNNFMTHVQNQRQAQLVDKGREAVKELKRDIPGWNEKVYNEIRHFAISAGLEPEIIDNLVDASAIKLIHKAMLYDRGKSGVVTKKKGNAPKKVIKTSKSLGATTKDLVGSKPDAARAMKKLKESGSTDDAANAFLARWQNSSDD